MVGLLQEGFSRTLNSKECVLWNTDPVRHSLWSARFGKITGLSLSCGASQHSTILKALKSPAKST